MTPRRAAALVASAVVVALSMELACGGAGATDGTPGGADGAVDAIAQDGAPVGDAGSCGAGKAMCGSMCVDIRSNPDHCGACGAICAATAPSTAECALGRCLVTLAVPAGSAAGIAVDSTHVYWSNPTAKNISRVPIGGGMPEPLVSGVSADRLEVDATHVYWSDGAGMRRVPRGGGAAESLGGPGGPFALGINDAYVVGSTSVVRLPKNGGPDAGVTLVTGTGGVAVRVAVDANRVYWTNLTGVISAPIGGGTTFPIASNGNKPRDIVTDSTFVYWVDTDSSLHSLMRAPLAGGEIKTLSGELCWSLALGAPSFYCLEPFGPMKKIPVDGGAAEQIVTKGASGYTEQIALDATSVYWATSVPGAAKVFRLTPR